MNITLENFDDNFVKKNTISLIFFYAEWCKPSLLQKAAAESLQNKIKDKYENKNIKIIIQCFDVDKYEDIADRFKANTLPTTVLFCHSEFVETLYGYQPEDFLEEYTDHLYNAVIEALKNEEKN